MTSSGSESSANVVEAPQIEEDDNDLAAMRRERVGGHHRTEWPLQVEARRSA